MKKEEARLKGKLHQPSRTVHFVSADDMVLQPWLNSLLGPVSQRRLMSRRTTTCRRMMKSRRTMKGCRMTKTRRTVMSRKTASSRRTASSRNAASALRTMKRLTTICKLSDAIEATGDKGMGWLGWDMVPT